MYSGAQAMVRTLVEAGVCVCFSNPGTSEMHFVAALDGEPQMRAVLTLFEGVATGAADGYARMADKPAAVLLHLGCGLGNGLANLHNARKGKTPVVTIVGDHATYHAPLDAQLQSDIETVAHNVSTWVRRSNSPAVLGADVAEAVSVSMGPPGQVATLIVPADVSWGAGAEVGVPVVTAVASKVDDARITRIAQVLNSNGSKALLLGGRALREPHLSTASKIAALTGAQLLAEVFPARMQRGAGVPHVERLAYFAELASVQLADIDDLVLVDTKPPVSFFAYPDKKSDLVPDGCTVHTLVASTEELASALERLSRYLGADKGSVVVQEAARPTCPPLGRTLTAERLCKAVGHLLPEQAIIVDEAQTSGVMLPMYTAGAPRHDILTLTGGAIGQGLPVAVGAAIASPERPVLALVGDGAAMYTIQSLWTMAREHLNITVIILNNRSYAILNVELQRVGVRSGAKARSQLDLSQPALDFVAMGLSMGVDSVRAGTTDAFVQALERCLSTPGPHLIEAVVPNALSGLKLRLLPYLLRSLQGLPQSLAKAIKRTIAP